MIKNLEKQREEIKEKLSQAIDEYYEEFSRSSNQTDFSINHVERLMLENQKQIRELMTEANNELTSSIDVAEKKCPECGGHFRRAKKDEELQIKTLSGELVISRDYYYCRQCKYKEVPLDNRLGIEGLPYKMTSELMYEVAYYGQNQHSFTDAADMLKRALHMEINKETVRTVTEEIGRLVHEADSIKATYRLNNMHEIEFEPDNEKKKGTLYIMTDGATVNTRIKDENGSTWRENKTAIAFTDKDIIKRKDDGNIIVKKEFTAYIGTAERFRGYVLDTAINAGYGTTQNVVIIGDGASWIRNMGKEVFPEAVQILDLYHLKENIYKYAKYKFTNNEKEYVPWAEIFIDKIEKGKAVEALNLLPEEENLPAGVVNLRTYINNNIDKIDYPQYKKLGYFVGSGAIESANKVILQRRLKQSGMRWSVPGAQYVLSLRAKAESGRWDSDVRSLA